MTLLSRITGLLRETIKAAAFGAGIQMDAFEAAFRLPNLLRRLFAEGAFSQAFVPILAEYRRKRGVDATRRLVGNVGTLLGVVLIALSVIGSLAAPWLVYLLAGGFARTPGKVELTADMIRIVFPYILFVSLVSLAGGVLNVFRKFAIPAFTPVLLNLSIIGALFSHSTASRTRLSFQLSPASSSAYVASELTPPHCPLFTFAGSLRASRPATGTASQFPLSFCFEYRNSTPFLIALSTSAGVAARLPKANPHNPMPTSARTIRRDMKPLRSRNLPFDVSSTRRRD